MVRITFIIICLFCSKIYSQSSDNLYTKDNVLIGNKAKVISECANGIAVKSSATYKEKYEVCECVMTLITKFYTAKELLALMNSGENPFESIFTSDNILIKTEFKDCSNKYLSLIDKSTNLKTLSSNFSKDFTIACQYTMNNEKGIDKNIFDVNKYCECVETELSKNGVTISTLKEFQDENSVSYNEIIQKCANSNAVIKNKEATLKENDVTSSKTYDYIPITNTGSSYKTKITFGEISKYFIIDSGATDSSISIDFERELLLEGIIKKENYLDDGYYILANGTQVKCRKLLLNNIRIGDFIVNNVTLSVRTSGNDLLLGKSFLNKFKTWTINNKDQNLYLEK